MEAASDRAQNFFGTQSQTRYCGTGSLRAVFRGLSFRFLKTLAAVFPDPTGRPWVSEDDL